MQTLWNGLLARSDDFSSLNNYLKRSLERINLSTFILCNDSLYFNTGFKI